MLGLLFFFSFFLSHAFLSYPEFEFCESCFPFFRFFLAGAVEESRLAIKNETKKSNVAKLLRDQNVNVVCFTGMASKYGRCEKKL